MLEFHLTTDIVIVLAIVAFFAACIDAIAGGGGLITVPALILAGVPPISALATNKLQGTFGVLSATVTFWKAGRIDENLAAPLAISAFFGGVIGAYFAHLAPEALLRLTIPILLLGIGTFMILVPKFGEDAVCQRMTIPIFAISVGASIGLYDGLFGPGAGTLYLIALISLCGFRLIRATAHTKLMNFASNLGALMFFASSGAINIPLGLCMGVMAVFGAWAGARLSLHFGTRLIRPLVVSVALIMAIRLILDDTHPLGAWLRG